MGKRLNTPGEYFKVVGPLPIKEGGLIVPVAVGNGTGTLAFRLNEIEQKSPSEIWCRLRMEYDLVGLIPRTFETRLNLWSNSGKESVARQIRRGFPRINLEWEHVLSEVFSAVLIYLETQDESIWIEQAPQVENRWLLEPLLRDGTSNMLFGKSNTLKTYISLRLAVSVLTSANFLEWKPTSMGRVLFVDFEEHDKGGEIRDRFYEILSSEELKGIHEDKILGGFRYIAATGRPLPNIVPTLKKIVRDHGIKLIIVDSAAVAAGAAPEDSETAVRYFNALGEIGATSLTIAHETKNSENTDYPFGSVFWKNLPRNIWRAEATAEPGSSVVEVGLYHKKINATNLYRPIPLRVYFGQGFVDIKRGSIITVDKGLPLNNRIWRLLHERPGLKRDEISDELGTPYPSIKLAIYRMIGRGKIIEIDNGRLMLTEVSTEPPLTNIC